MGSILEEIEYDFIIEGNNFACAQFKLKLLNKSIINIKAYNNLADYCYRYLNKNDIVFIQGYLNSDLIVYATEVTKNYGQCVPNPN